MSKVKDLMHAILNEGIEEDEDEVVETKVELPVQEEVQEQPTFVEPKIKPISTDNASIPDFFDDTKKEKTEKKASIFDGMSYDEVSSDKNRKKPKKSEYHYDRSKIKQNLNKEDFEYSPVISPIFGNAQEEKKEFDKVHNAVDLKKPSDDFTFTKVISPMYGNDIPTPKPVEQIPPKRVVKKENVQSEYTLKDMLSSPDKKDTKQKSLFDEE
ncbi:MAG: hypothetical protein PUH10_08655 [Erysipelotrichaceae bacterium]|uniref:hypothetical protein n=1 Tax=Floccifex sp. TaxID=2815810 RepID=UPI002A749AD9|nr:hypothetical protein [Floccifex sp.]MDD7282038.1 hypothetical protein [Erysipelotrichaceae bacterium]MDY2958106.1 hypothetical protein [Floccifex sp.]